MRAEEGQIGCMCRDCHVDEATADLVCRLTFALQQASAAPERLSPYGHVDATSRALNARQDSILSAVPLCDGCSSDT